MNTGGRKNPPCFLMSYGNPIQKHMQEDVSVIFGKYQKENPYSEFPSKNSKKSPDFLTYLFEICENAIFLIHEESE
jgi:hypothetical protein